ncbi:MAG: hypothetical protein KBF41_15860 [Azonexus sp.]|nr:hypothetical protein [Azonexus sp.]
MPAAPQPGLYYGTWVRYEVALDVLGAMISHYAEAIALARDQGDSAAGMVASLQGLQAEIRNRRDALDPDDAVAIEAVIATYGPQARQAFSAADEEAMPTGVFAQ